MKDHHAESMLCFGGASTEDWSSPKLPAVSSRLSHLGNTWELEYGIAWMAEGCKCYQQAWKWGGLCYPSVQWGGMLWGCPHNCFSKMVQTKWNLKGWKQSTGIWIMEFKSSLSSLFVHTLGAFPLLHRGTQCTHHSWFAGVCVGLCRKCLVIYVPEC